MSIIRTARCAIRDCTARREEQQYGEGFSGWIQISGVALNGHPNPMICPRHRDIIMEFVDSLEIEK